MNIFRVPATLNTFACSLTTCIWHLFSPNWTLLWRCKELPINVCFCQQVWLECLGTEPLEGGEHVQGGFNRDLTRKCEIIAILILIFLAMEGYPSEQPRPDRGPGGWRHGLWGHRSYWLGLSGDRDKVMILMTLRMMHWKHSHIRFQN